MREQQRSGTKRDIRNIILVLLAAVVFAVGLSAYMILKYGPTGHYWVSNILIEPVVAKEMDYFEPSTGKGKPNRFVLNGFEFSYFDPAVKNFKKISIDLEAYENFYAMIGQEKSISDVPSEVISFFNDSSTATLTISVREAASSQSSTKVFQMVQFSQKDGYYRIQLHQQNSADNWIYFYHSGIYQSVMKLFTESR